MIRIFVSSSHLSTLYMILYARATRRDDHKDVLIIDSPPKKASLKGLIKGTNKFHPWAKIIDLSVDLDDSAQLKVSARKNITRKLKSKPGFRQIYDVLLKRYNNKTRAKEAAIITEQLQGLGEASEINVLTQTLVNDALFNLYPKAQVNYFEHGLGDYYHIQKINKKDNFYCVFAEGFKKYLSADQKENAYVHQLPGYENFVRITSEALTNEDPQVLQASRIEGKMILVLGEAMQLYQVPDNYYVDFIDLVMKHVKDPKSYTFVLKPHPAQTSDSISAQKKRLEEHYKVRTIVLQDARLANFSVEVLFSQWKDQAGQFFSQISSAGFYNSILYQDCGSKFYYSYEFLLPYIKGAAPQYKNAYFESEELIKTVFGAKSIPLQM